MALDFKKALKESGELLKKGAEKAQDTIKSPEFQNSVNEWKGRGKDTASFLKKKTEETVQSLSGMPAKQEIIEGMITVEGALKLVYVVMAADECVSEEELEQFREIGMGFDPNFSENQQLLLEDIGTLVEEMGEEEYTEELRDLVRGIIFRNLNSTEATVPVKMLLWDMLVVAFCDQDYADCEKKMIAYIAKHLKIDKSILSEMENSIRALMAVEKEISWLREVQRPYKEVEVQMNELTVRKDAIMQGIEMLISE